METDTLSHHTFNKTDTITVYYQNVRGIHTKLQILLENVTSCEYDIIVMNEIWLTNGHTDSEFNMIDYNIYRKDRTQETSNHSRGGGVLIAFHKDINSKVIKSSQNYEYLFVLLGQVNTQNILSVAYFHHLLLEINQIYDQFPSGHFAFLEILIFHSAWLNDNLSSIAAPSFKASPTEAESLEVLSNMCAFHNLFQLNSIHNNVNLTLDLIFMQNHNISVDRADFDIVQIDGFHPPLIFKLSFNDNNLPGSMPQGFYRAFKSADTESILIFF